MNAWQHFYFLLLFLLVSGENAVSQLLQLKYGTRRVIIITEPLSFPFSFSSFSRTLQESHLVALMASD
jgi:hypothetical protein